MSSPNPLSPTSTTSSTGSDLRSVSRGSSVTASTNIRHKVPSGQKYYNNHTLYVDSGAIPESALLNMIQNGIREIVGNARKEFKLTVNPRFKINFKKTKTGTIMGYAYIWVEDPVLYNLLQNLNPDGSKRIETIPDPDWKEPEPKQDTPVKTEPIFTFKPGMKWSDYAEFDEDEDEELQKIQPMITRELPNLVNWPEFQYTESEKDIALNINKYALYTEAYKLFKENIFIRDNAIESDYKTEFEKLCKSMNRAITDNDVIEENTELITYHTIIYTFNSLNVNYMFELSQLIDGIYENLNFIYGNYDIDDDKPNFHIIKVFGAYATNPEEHELKYSLSAKIFSGELPDPKVLETIFKDDSSYPGFPKASVDYKNRIAYITFNNKSRDAQFALYMNKIVNYKSPKTRNITTIVFNLARDYKNINKS
jgi:hypothetical protein